MGIIKIIVVFSLMIFGVAIDTAQSELICVKNRIRVRDNSVNLSNGMRAVVSSCPSGFTQILDTNQILPESIPTGKTIRGFFAAAGYATTGSELFTSDLHFPLPTADATIGGIHIIPFGNTPPAECPGSTSNAQALPGSLCIYESMQTNVLDRYVLGLSGDGSGSRFGLTYYISVLVAGFPAASVGVWAYTAP